MGENSEFNKTVLEKLKASLQSAGIELVSTSTYDAETNDFTSILTKIKASNPDMIYVADAYPARAAQLWKQVRQLGGFKIEAMSPGVVTPGMIKPSEGAMNGVITGEIFMASDPGAEGNPHDDRDESLVGDALKEPHVSVRDFFKAVIETVQCLRQQISLLWPSVCILQDHGAQYGCHGERYETGEHY